MSCWAMLNLNVLLLTFLAASCLASSVSTTSAQSCKCYIKNGREINQKDEGCETYKLCKNFQCSLVRCPDAGQFDFDSKTCKPNSEVWCQWQYQRMEAKQQSNSRQRQRQAANQNKNQDNKEYDENYDEEYDKNYNYDGNSQGTKGDSDYEYEYKDGGKIPDFDTEDYVCETEYGHEPNLDDLKCKSFWRCDEYEGSLIDCKYGLLYDYFAKACRHYSEVSCKSQMEDFFKTQSTKMDNRDNKDHKGNTGKKDKSPTVVHHFYHGSARPKINSKGGDFDESARVRHVFVNKGKSEDSRMQPIRMPESHGH